MQYNIHKTHILTYTWPRLMVLAVWRWCLALLAIHPFRTCFKIISRIQLAILWEPSSRRTSLRGWFCLLLDLSKRPSCTNRIQVACFYNSNVVLEPSKLRSCCVDVCHHPSNCDYPSYTAHLARTACFCNTSSVLEPFIRVVITSWWCLRLSPSWLIDVPVDVVGRVRRVDECAIGSKHTAKKTRACRMDEGESESMWGKDEMRPYRTRVCEWMTKCKWLSVPCNVCVWFDIAWRSLSRHLVRKLVTLHIYICNVQCILVVLHHWCNNH